MSLTAEEILQMRAMYSYYTDSTLERLIDEHKAGINIMQEKIGDKHDIVKLLETILDERVP